MKNTTNTKQQAVRITEGSAFIPGRGASARAIVREGGWWHTDPAGPTWRSLEYQPQKPSPEQLSKGPLDAIQKAGGYWLERGDGQGRSFVANSAGRPRKGAPTAEPSLPRSVRLPKRIWQELDEVAARSLVTTNALMRDAVARLLRDHQTQMSCPKAVSPQALAKRPKAKIRKTSDRSKAVGDTPR